MSNSVPQRLPAVKTLYDILPKGAEGGKEFARIVDLLLFHEARRTGRSITLFSDAAGDYHGMDSFAGTAHRRSGTTGYQYKFYPSPLSAEHRKSIEKSLTPTLDHREELKLKKWIAITPQDLTESSTRKDGGDITWFQELRRRAEPEVELDHWGHTQLLSLFLETPSLCLYYYPELVSEGTKRKRTIQETRQRYDDNLLSLYRHIEFVGMSVYKPEATRGVPMEQIYIPLALIPPSEAGDSAAPRSNPSDRLMPGVKTVILGDPGSGKSTLLRFLALVGISAPLQQRYDAEADVRLPVFVVLRRYADELKQRRNLSLLDYILEQVQADFNLPSADFEFFEYYLESGQAILLFDGLDELPNSQFKKVVADRIRSLVTTYPGNTVIVSSRIVGYENPFRFDEKEFQHYHVARLRLPEIERFVHDWYTVRVENPQERAIWVNGLVNILRDESHLAIRDLAENPLLLTIVALVHRIDAVLPDERVVLYQKCTETLLVSWHTWKYQEEVQNRGKVERRNRRRIEAIAHWMHSASLGTGKNQRSVVAYSVLHEFLVDHIRLIEKTWDQESDPEDLATDFLEFVRKRAGLLIEVGDEQYSFVHLTFQEYLTSSHLITVNEMAGVGGIWAAISTHADDSRWSEVIRLLVAGLKSDEGQEYLLGQLLEQDPASQSVTHAQLIGGLLLDGIGPAEMRDEEIIRRLVIAASIAGTQDEVQSLLGSVRVWLERDPTKHEVLAELLRGFASQCVVGQEATALSLVVFTLQKLIPGMTPVENAIIQLNRRDEEFWSLLLLGKRPADGFHKIGRQLERLRRSQLFYSLDSPGGNIVAAALHATLLGVEERMAWKQAFELQLACLGTTIHGPFDVSTRFQFELSEMMQCVFASDFHSRASSEHPGFRFSRDLLVALKSVGINTLNSKRARGGKLRQPRLDSVRRLVDGDGPFHIDWSGILGTPSAYGTILEVICNCLGLAPQPQWREALRTGYLPDVPARSILFNSETWEATRMAFVEGRAGEADAYTASWLLLFDVWSQPQGIFSPIQRPMLHSLAESTRSVPAAPLQIAHCIRDLAYGDVTRAADLKAMVWSDDPQYREIFERACWHPMESSG